MRLVVRLDYFLMRIDRKVNVTRAFFLSVRTLGHVFRAPRQQDAGQSVFRNLSVSHRIARSAPALWETANARDIDGPSRTNPVEAP